MLDYSNAPNAEAKDRILAGLIDLIVVGAVLSFLSMITDNWGIQGGIWLIYFLTRDNLFNGGIGKKAMKLLVVKEDGIPVKGDWGVAIMHNLFAALQFWWLELIMVLATGQSIGQRIAKTRVVKIG